MFMLMLQLSSLAHKLLMLMFMLMLVSLVRTGLNLLADLPQVDVFYCFLTLQPGDEVEFVVVQNQKSRKMSACSLRRIWLVQP